MTNQLPSDLQTDDNKRADSHLDAEHAREQMPDEPNWEVARQKMDLTLLLARHANVEDAEQTLRHVDPNSMVFVEGYTRPEEDIEDSRASAEVFWALNMFHICEGVSGAKYLQVKDLIQESYSTVSSDGKGAYEKTLVLGLLKKDCIIANADYQAHLMPADEFTTQGFDALGRDIDLQGSLGKRARKGQAYKRLIQSVTREVSIHDFREGAGLAFMMAHFTNFVDMLGRSTEPSGLAVGKEGKLQAYLIYGTAHKHTLLGKLSERGIKPQTIETTGSVPEFQYLEGVVGMNRQLAFSAMLYAGLVGRTDYDNVYSRLARYNSLPEEEVKKLALSAIEWAQTPGPDEVVASKKDAFYRTYVR